MTENHENREKVDELLLKIKTLGTRAKEVRSSFGSPLADRVGTRLDKLLTRLPQQHNGDSNPQRQAQTSVKACPKCFKQFPDDANFCDKCGFNFRAEEFEERHRREAQEKLERFSTIGVIPP